MLRFSFFSFLIILLISRYSCQINYELDIQGETQHGYYVTLYIGTPPQSIKLIIDTGSSNLAIACTPPLNESKTYFHFKNSDTFHKLPTLINLHYVQGHWSGFFGTDFVSLDNTNDHSVKSIMACMNNISDVFDVNSPFDGLLGLAYPAVSHPNSSILSLFDTVQNIQNISDIFAINFCGPYYSDGEAATTSCGKLHLGFFSPDQFKGEIIYTPIVKERLYEVTLTDLKVGSTQITTDCKALNQPMTVIDSGTTELFLPKLMYDKTIKEIQKGIKHNQQSFWLNETIGCFPKHLYNISAFPIITLSFYHTSKSSFSLYITSELYLLPWADFSIDILCFRLAISESKNFGTLIGSSILKGYYVIFDRKNKQIGFGNSTFSQDLDDLKNYVSDPEHLPNSNFESCKCDDCFDDSSKITVGTVVLLIISLTLTIVFLYTMIAGIRTCLGKRFDYNSDTNNLVADDFNNLHGF